MSRDLPVQEMFHSFQGEGAFAGEYAFFVRLLGCPLKCPWCDSAGTWHPDYIPEKKTLISPRKIAQAASVGVKRPTFVVITGGEPTIHNLEPLCEELRKEGHRIHLETSGSFPLQAKRIDWLTLSPKWAKLPLPENTILADEVKIIVDNESAITRWETQLEDNLLSAAQLGRCSLYLHLEWSQRDNRNLQRQIVQAVKESPYPYRVGYQLHKLFDADRFDPNAVGPAPLGGNPALGY